MRAIRSDDVEHVRGARGEQRVIERGQLGRGRRARGQDRGDAVLALLADPRRRAVHERRVPGHRGMGHEDRGLVLVALGADPLGQGHQVIGGGVRGVAQPRVLRLDGIRRHATADRQLPAPDMDPRPARHAGRRRDTRQPDRRQPHAASRWSARDVRRRARIVGQRRRRRKGLPAHFRTTNASASTRGRPLVPSTTTLIVRASESVYRFVQTWTRYFEVAA